MSGLRLRNDDPHAASPNAIGSTALEALIVCACGHAIGRHDAGGCGGTRPRHCGCERHPGAVLDWAIAHATAGDPHAA